MSCSSMAEKRARTLRCLGCVIRDCLPCHTHSLHFQWNLNSVPSRVSWVPSQTPALFIHLSTCLQGFGSELLKLLN